PHPDMRGEKNRQWYRSAEPAGIGLPRPRQGRTHPGLRAGGGVGVPTQALGQKVMARRIPYLKSPAQDPPHLFDAHKKYLEIRKDAETYSSPQNGFIQGS